MQWGSLCQTISFTVITPAFFPEDADKYTAHVLSATTPSRPTATLLVARIGYLLDERAALRPRLDTHGNFSCRASSTLLLYQWKLCGRQIATHHDRKRGVTAIYRVAMMQMFKDCFRAMSPNKANSTLGQMRVRGWADSGHPPQSKTGAETFVNLSIKRLCLFGLASLYRSSNQAQTSQQQSIGLGFRDGWQ